MEQGPDFWCWFDTTQFSYHCVHPIHAKMISIQMLLHFSQIVQRVCTLVLFIKLSKNDSSLDDMTFSFILGKYIENAGITNAPVPSVVALNIPGAVSKLLTCGQLANQGQSDYMKLTVFWPTVNVESMDSAGVSHKTVNQSLWLDTNEVGAGTGQNWNVACGTFVFDREMTDDISSAFTFS